MLVARASILHGVRMSLQGPDELIAAVPYLLGFHPRESVVLVWVTDGTVTLTQRFDLADMPRTAEEAIPVLQAGSYVQATAVIVLLYTDEVPNAQSLTWLTGLGASDVEVIDLIHTVGDRWWSLGCEQECCPPHGREIDPVLHERIAADFVLAGVVAYADRSDLVHEVDVDPILMEATIAALGDVSSQPPAALLKTCLRQWRRVQRQQQIGARACAVHIAALRDVQTRDRLGWQLAHLDRTSLLAVCWLLRIVLRSAPPGDIAPIATISGIAHWLAGDGARAMACLERALADDPTYVLGQLIAQTLRAGLPPAQWREMLRAIPAPALTA